MLALTGCGGSEEPEDAAAAQKPSEDPETYTVANREQFLASGPDCDALTTWFTHNPRDEDLPTIGRHVEECGTIPEAHADNGYVMLELRKEIFDSAELGSATRTDLHKALAAEACTNFGNGERSPYQVAADVDVEGGTADDTTAILDLAAETCTEHAEDLLAFKPVDLVQAGDELTAFAAKRWPDGIAGTPELVALAQMVCVGSDDAFDVDATDMIIETGLESGAAAEFRRHVTTTMCR